MKTLEELKDKYYKLDAERYDLFREIARHFGKYFGTLIIEAKYADLVDFEIIEEKYKI